MNKVVVKPHFVTYLILADFLYIFWRGKNIYIKQKLNTGLQISGYRDLKSYTDKQKLNILNEYIPLNLRFLFVMFYKAVFFTSKIFDK